MRGVKRAAHRGCKRELYIGDKALKSHHWTWAALRLRLTCKLDSLNKLLHLKEILLISAFELQFGVKVVVRCSEGSLKVCWLRVVSSFESSSLRGLPLLPSNLSSARERFTVPNDEWWAIDQAQASVTYTFVLNTLQRIDSLIIW